MLPIMGPCSYHMGPCGSQRGLGVFQMGPYGSHVSPCGFYMGPCGSHVMGLALLGNGAMIYIYIYICMIANSLYIVYRTILHIILWLLSY